jgi:hypothetical protein
MKIQLIKRKLMQREKSGPGNVCGVILENSGLNKKLNPAAKKGMMTLYFLTRL